MIRLQSARSVRDGFGLDSYGGELDEATEGNRERREEGGRRATGGETAKGGGRGSRSIEGRVRMGRATGRSEGIQGEGEDGQFVEAERQGREVGTSVTVPRLNTRRRRSKTYL